MNDACGPSPRRAVRPVPVHFWISPPPTMNRSEASSAKTGRSEPSRIVFESELDRAVQVVGAESDRPHSLRSSVTPTTQVFQRYRPTKADDSRPVVE